MLIGKIFFFNGWIGKKVSLDKMSYFPEAYIRSENQVKVELDLFHYAKKPAPKGSTGRSTTDLAKKYWLS